MKDIDRYGLFHIFLSFFAGGALIVFVFLMCAPEYALYGNDLVCRGVYTKLSTGGAS